MVEKIETEITPILAELGYEIVRVAIFGGEGRKTLQIMIERTDNENITVEDCEKASRSVAICLDVMDPIKQGYDLEMSSTGINRPLVKTKDFIKFCGKDVVVKTFSQKNNRKTFKGLLEFASENGIKLKLEEPLETGEYVIDLAYDEISNAHVDGFKV